ncbi:glycosyltransferase family 4 protein [Sphingobacterium siyangense]|uniref:glycosyltransferase family 4 protein n=1 Tax=Sphingobacterium siyangense TaxID=459529 RepID=UPI003DA4D8D2
MEKILIVDLTPFFGGGQRFVLSLADAFPQTDVALYSIVKCKQLYDILPKNTSYFLGTEGKIGAIKIINEQIKLNRIDKVILNGNAVIYLAPFIRCKNKIAYKHTSNNAFSGIRQILGPLLLNFSYLFCHRIVLLYNKSRNEVFSFNRSKVNIIYNGISIKNKPAQVKKSICTEKIIFGVVSRVEANKGLEWLIKVFIEKFNSDKVELRIAGDGPHMGKLKDMIASSNVKNIVLKGFIHDVDHFLGELDVFILPSRFESFPLSILEAMSSSLPIIATDSGGVSEMVTTNYNGFLIDYKNDFSLCTAIETLIRDREARLLFGKNSLNLVKDKFDIAMQISKIKQV